MIRYCEASFQSMARLTDPLVTSYNGKLTQGRVNNVNQLVTHTVSRPLFQTDCFVCFTKYFSLFGGKILKIDSCDDANFVATVTVSSAFHFNRLPNVAEFQKSAKEENGIL